MLGRWNLLITLLSCAAVCARSHGAVHVSIHATPSIILPDPVGRATVAFDVHVSSDGETSTLRAYDLFVDIEPEGTSLPTGWSTQLPEASAHHLFFNASVNPSAGDVGASGLFSPGLDLSATRSLWQFSVTVDRAQGATDGAYFVHFATDSLNFSLKDAAGNALPYRLEGTTVTLDRFWGDFNLDGSIDAADAARLFAHWGDLPPEEGSLVDHNHDGHVDAADAGALFEVWTGDFLSAVPEPRGTSAWLAWLIWTSARWARRQLDAMDRGQRGLSKSAVSIAL